MNMRSRCPPRRLRTRPIVVLTLRCPPAVLPPFARRRRPDRCCSGKRRRSGHGMKPCGRSLFQQDCPQANVRCRRRRCKPNRRHRRRESKPWLNRKQSRLRNGQLCHHGSEIKMTSLGPKQTVNPAPPPSPHPVPPPAPLPLPVPANISCEIITGTIFQLCDGVPHIYYVASDPASGIVRVSNETKGTMRVVIEITTGVPVEGSVEQGQQVSFDVPPIRRVSIIGSGEGGVCKGRFVIRLRRTT